MDRQCKMSPDYGLPLVTLVPYNYRYESLAVDRDLCLHHGDLAGVAQAEIESRHSRSNGPNRDRVRGRGRRKRFSLSSELVQSRELVLWPGQVLAQPWRAISERLDSTHLQLRLAHVRIPIFVSGRSRKKDVTF